MHSLSSSIRPIARRAWRTSAAAIATALLAACSTEPVTGNDPDDRPAPVTVARVDLTGASWIIEQGSASYSATIVGSNGNTLNDRPVAWASSDTTIAIVSNGVVFAKRAGEVTLSATAGGKAATLRIIVRALTVDSVIVRLDGGVYAGESSRAGAELRAADGRHLPDRLVSWASLDPSIATIDVEGRIRGLRAGTVDIVATSEGRSGRLQVTVRESRAGGAWEVSIPDLRNGSTLCTYTKLALDLRISGTDVRGSLMYDVWTGLPTGSLTCVALVGGTGTPSAPAAPAGPFTGTIDENGYLVLTSSNGWQFSGVVNREAKTWTGSVIVRDGEPVNGIVPVRSGSFVAAKR